MEPSLPSILRLMRLKGSCFKSRHRLIRYSNTTHSTDEDAEAQRQSNYFINLKDGRERL